MVKSKKAAPKKRNLNVEAAYLHILGDVLNSVGVIIASSLIYFDERLWYLDPICTLFFACIVFYTTRITFYQCCAILMEATPDEFDTYEITKSLEKIEGVGLVHDVHLLPWAEFGFQMALGTRDWCHRPMNISSLNSRARAASTSPISNKRARAADCTRWCLKCKENRLLLELHVQSQGHL